MDEAIAEIAGFKGAIRDLRVLVIAGGVLIASVAFAGWWYLGRSSDQAVQRDRAAQVRGFKLRGVACYNAWVDSGTGPADCLEPAMHPYFDPRDVTARLATSADNQKTRALICGDLRLSPRGQDFVHQFEVETGERCEDAPRGP